MRRKEEKESKERMTREDLHGLSINIIPFLDIF